MGIWELLNVIGLVLCDGSDQCELTLWSNRELSTVQKSL